MSKIFIRSARMVAVAALVVVGGFGLSACAGKCCGCDAGPAVYKKPCCAGQAAAPCGCSKAAPAPATMAAPAMPAPAGGAKACGAGKCG